MPPPPPIVTVSVVHSQAKSNSVHPVLEMLMGGDLTAERRCELHVSTEAAVWRTKTERSAAKWRCVFGIPAAGSQTEGNQITTTQIASCAL
jgi:hypothetical protein